MLKFELTILNNVNEEETRGIIIEIPKQKQELEKDFTYLNLNYEELKENQTKVEEVKVKLDNEYMYELGRRLDCIIERANIDGINTSYSKIKEVYKLLENKTEEELKKIEKIIDYEIDSICNIDDAISFIKKEHEYKFYPNILEPADFAREKIEKEFPNALWLIDYLDLCKLGFEITDSPNYMFTDKGLLVKKENIKEMEKHTIFYRKKHRHKEDELEK